MRHQVVIRDQLGDQAANKPTRKLLLPEVGYYTLLDWSPDGARLVLQDNHLNLYQLPLSGPQSGKLAKIDTSERRAGFDVSFSPDGRYLAYTVVGKNFFSQSSRGSPNRSISSKLSAPRMTAHRVTPRMSDRAYLLVRSTRGSGNSAKYWAKLMSGVGMAGPPWL